MRTLPISSASIKFSNSFKSADNIEPKLTQIPITGEEFKKDEKKFNKPNLVTAAVAVAALGISAYTLKSRAKQEIANEGKKIAEEAITKAEKAKEEAVAAAEEKMHELKETINDLTSKINSNEANLAEKQQWNEGYLNGLNKKVEDLQNAPVLVEGTKARWQHNVDGLHLMKNPKPLKDNVIEKIRTAAPKFIYGQAAIPALGAGAVVWLPTAETLPEKEGGLGEVPVQMSINMDKELGIENYLVRPLMEVPGKSTLIETDGKYKYWYKGLKDDGIDVTKIVEFNVNSVRNGQQETHNVEVFTGIDNKGCKRIMFRCPAYFKASGLYQDSSTSAEKERYNFFSKLVYEFAKLKADKNSQTSYKIFDSKEYDAIKAPDTMVLNDWHTAPVAALMRLMAPAEASNDELSSSVAETFENMNLLYIVHNLDYHGWGNEYSSDMINTLFDKYAYDIHKNAETGFTETVIHPDGRKETVKNESLSKVLTVNGNVNMANMALAYASTVKPVSPTYASEIASEVERGGALTHIAHERFVPKTELGKETKQTMYGQSNGWDRSSNEFSEKNISGFPKEKLNEDKYKIFKYTIEHLDGLTLENKKNINNILKNDINQKNFEKISLDLVQLGIPQVTETINKLTSEGFFNLRSFVPVTADMPLDQIIEGRKFNKRAYIDSLKQMLGFNKEQKHNEVFKFNVCEYTDLSDITDENIDSIPVFNMGVRFVSQKGVPIAAGAWEHILNNWDNLYPGRPRPIVLIGGEDAEGGVHSRNIDETKIRLKEKGNHLVHLDGFTPNPDWMGASDWTMRPSYFEPDGDKWESLYKGTPAVMTKTGGHIDSIKDGNGILTARTMKEIRDEIKASGITDEARIQQRLTEEATKDYIEALKKCLNAFYKIGSQPHQNSYVDKAIHGNQSWVQKDEAGKIIECPIIGHVRDLGFNLKDFNQVADTVA